MQQTLLLPNKFKKWGWIILIPSTIMGIISLVLDFSAFKLNTTVFAIVYGLFETKYFGFVTTNIADTLIGIFFLGGALLVGFSREKNEDEFISSLRQSSLLWAILVNYVLLIFSFVFVYGNVFAYIILYNAFSVLIIYLVRFNFVLYRSNNP